MEKIIIENRTKLPTTQLFYYIAYIIGMGRINNNDTQYCYASVFKISTGEEIMIYTDKNKCSDRFVITLNSKGEKNGDN